MLQNPVISKAEIMKKGDDVNKFPTYSVNKKEKFDSLQRVKRFVLHIVLEHIVCVRVHLSSFSSFVKM